MKAAKHIMSASPQNHCIGDSSANAVANKISLAKAATKSVPDTAIGRYLFLHFVDGLHHAIVSIGVKVVVM
jgi:hypothetical protein